MRQSFHVNSSLYPKSSINQDIGISFLSGSYDLVLYFLKLSHEASLVFIWYWSNLSQQDVSHEERTCIKFYVVGVQKNTISNCWSKCVSVFLLSFYNAHGFPKRCPCYLKWRLLVLVVKVYFYVFIHITVEVVFRPGILVVKTETPDLQGDILFQSSLVPVRSQLLRLLHRFGHVLTHKSVHIRTFPSKSRLIQ